MVKRVFFANCSPKTHGFSPINGTKHHSFPGKACKRDLISVRTSPPKGRKELYSNHPFSGANLLLVSGRGIKPWPFFPQSHPQTETWRIIKLSLTWGQLWRRSPTWPWERAIWSEKSYCGRMAYGLARAHGVTMYTFDRKVYKIFWNFGLRRKLVNQKNTWFFFAPKWSPGFVK